jgi:TP901 family phage tail tape measure protein
MADGVGSFLGAAGLGGAIGKAVVQLELDSSKYVAEMRAAQAGTVASSKAMASSLSTVGTAGLAALGILGALSVKLALDFDKSFTRIAAITNTSAGAIEGMKEEVLALSGETAQAPTELADALFFLSSAGLDAADVMPALEASAKASAVGLGTTADVANIVASALNAYSKSGLTAAAATDVLVAAVREGRAEPEEFANALGRILPIASTVGVTFDQVAASMAALSNIGLDVNEGVTAMRGVLQAIAAPGTQAAEALDQLGLSAQDLLDSIAEDGIIGALRLLDEAAKEQTSTQAEYNNVLRQIVPNIRALTGVLGLTVQEASKVDTIFDNVQNSTGDLADAFGTTAESEAFRLQKALNDLAVQATALGGRALPSIANALEFLGPLLSQVFENLDALLALFLAFKAGGALAAAGFSTLGAAIGPVTGIIVGAVMAGRALNDIFFAADQTVEELAAAVSGQLKPALEEGIISTQLYVEASRALRDLSIENAPALLRVQAAIEATQRAEERELLIKEASLNAWKSYEQVLIAGAHAAQEAGAGAQEGAEGVRELGDAAREAMKAFKESVVASTQVAIGQFAKMNEAFSITPKELREQLTLAINIAKRFGSDLREILTDKTLSQEQRRALASLPPEYRRAFVESGKEAKEQLAQDAVTLSRLNARNWGDFATAAKPKAKQGGKETGAAMMQGAITGIVEGSPAVSAAAATAVKQAIAAAKRAAGAQSPSKEMAKLGVDMMVGLADGISDAEQKAIDAARDAISKLVDRVGSELEKVKGKMASFADAIRGGFSEFSDLGGAFGSETFEGAGLGTIIQTQLAGAQHLADVLEALKRQGAGKALLQQVAESGAGFGQELLAGGPEQIAEANEALRTIAELSRQTGKALSESFFGNKVERLEAKLDRLHDDLRELAALERRGHSHDVVLDGEKVSTTTEKGLTRILDRRGSLFDGAVRK